MTLQIVVTAGLATGAMAQTFAPYHALGPRASEAVASEASRDGTPDARSGVHGPPRPVDVRGMRALMGVRVGPAGPQVTSIDVNGGIDGDMPREVAFLADGSAAAIVHRDSNNVTFLDVASRAINRTVSVGEFPVHIAATPDGRFVITANVLSDSVSVIDLSDFSVTEIPITGTQPYRVEVTGDGAYAVVGVINNATNATFSVIDLETLAEVRSFAGGTQGVIGGFGNSTFPIFGNLFTTFALAPDNRTIVLPESGSQSSTIRLFDLTTGTQTNTFPGLPTGARGVDISDDGSLAAITHTGSANQITIIDLASRTIADTISADVDEFIRVFPDNSAVVTHSLNDTLIYDLSTGSEVFRQQSGVVGDIEISFDGAIAFISNFNSRLLDLASRAFVNTLTIAATSESAASPVAHDAVGLNNRFGEDAHLYDIDGPSGAVLAQLRSGELPEGDAPFDLDVSASGDIAVVGMTLSANVAVLDLRTNSLLALIDTGLRVMDVEITPDGTHAVACDGDSNQISIIDLAALEVVRTLPISTRPGRVLISPDSSEAYVLNVAGTDRIWFITLDGANSEIAGSISAGQTGSSFGAQYSETSGLALTADGSILAVCDSFNNNIKLIETQSRSLIANVPAGDFPIRAEFSPDGVRCYATNINGDTITIIDVPSRSVAATISIAPLGGDRPLAIQTDADRAYVADYNTQAGSRIYVIDRATNALLSTFPVGRGVVRDLQIHPTRPILYAIVNANDNAPAEVFALETGDVLQEFARAPMGGNALDMDFSASEGAIVISQPFLDAVDVVRFDSCLADLDADGDADADDFFLYLDAFASFDTEVCDQDTDRDCDADDFFRYLDLFAQGC